MSDKGHFEDSILLAFLPCMESNLIQVGNTGVFICPAVWLFGNEKIFEEVEFWLAHTMGSTYGYHIPWFRNLFCTNQLYTSPFY